MSAGRFEAGYVFPGTVYRVIRHIATGGMGSLYEVEDDTVGRRFVLKTLHPELVDRDDLAIRMREEARALGRLHHPNIVQVITAGVTSDAQKMPFYVMEKLVGQNLRTVLDVRKADGGVGLGQALRIAIDVANALQHAHQHQLVHRDVKPENIFLHRGPKGTEVKLVDFGIVRLLTRDAYLTRGKYIGTLKYSSPEQITGLGELGPASDIYCLGLVLYEMIRLRGPFDDITDHMKIGFAHAQDVPSPLSLHVATVPPDVDALVMRCLAKSPQDRPPSCAAFAASLRAALRTLDASPSHRTDVELLTAEHSVNLGAQQATVTSAELPPTKPEGQLVAPDTVPDPSIDPTQAAPPATPLMEPAFSNPKATQRLDYGAPRAGASPYGTQLMGPPGASGPPPAPPPARVVDRDAPTRVPAPAVEAPRAPTHDTVVEPPSVQPTAPMLSAPPPVLAPPAAAVPQIFISTVQTRPRRRDRRSVVVVGVAAALAVMMIAGAVLFVRRPPAGHDAPATVNPSPK